MKRFKNTAIAFLIVAFVGSFAVVASANYGQHKMMNAGTVKTLRDSAAALQKTNPDLASQLTALADQHEKAMAMHKSWHEKKIKAVKDSAMALQASRPDLAKGLNEYADRKTKEMEGTGTAETKENRAADMKLLQDSSAALQASNPDLANQLGMCAAKADMKAKMMTETGENEEAEGTPAPASESKEM